MTLDCIKIDLSTIFEYGQAYVGLSRVKSSAGLSITGLDWNKIKAHPKALAYYKSLENLQSKSSIKTLENLQSKSSIKTLEKVGGINIYSPMISQKKSIKLILFFKSLRTLSTFKLF